MKEDTPTIRALTDMWSDLLFNHRLSVKFASCKNGCIFTRDDDIVIVFVDDGEDGTYKVSLTVVTYDSVFGCETEPMNRVTIPDWSQKSRYRIVTEIKKAFEKAKGE